jgi:F-type H+-transporting ATPase subunit b
MGALDSLLKSLNIVPLVIVLNAVVFLLLLFIMDRLFWKPVMRHLEQRKDDIAHAYTTVEDARREMEALRADYQSRLARIEAEARGQIQQTVRSAQAQREDLLAAARQQAEQVAREGAQAIAAEREQALVGLRDTLDDVALEALSRVTGGAADARQRQLVDEYIARRS